MVILVMLMVYAVVKLVVLSVTNVIHVEMVISTFLHAKVELFIYIPTHIV